MSRRAISQGIRELEEGAAGDTDSSPRIRKEGGGRKKATEIDPALLSDLESLVSPLTRGDPMSPLRWTCKSTRQLAKALMEMGHPEVSQKVVGRLLHELGSTSIDPENP